MAAGLSMVREKSAQEMENNMKKFNILLAAGILILAFGCKDTENETEFCRDVVVLISEEAPRIMRNT